MISNYEKVISKMGVKIGGGENGRNLLYSLEKNIIYASQHVPCVFHMSNGVGFCTFPRVYFHHDLFKNVLSL